MPFRKKIAACDELLTLVGEPGERPNRSHVLRERGHAWMSLEGYDRAIKDFGK
jgi:hypothetical protein